MNDKEYFEKIKSQPESQNLSLQQYKSGGLVNFDGDSIINAVIDSIEAKIPKNRNRELNSGLPRSQYNLLSSFIKTEEERDMILTAISNGNFELKKAIQAHDNPLKKYLDRSLSPKIYQDAIKSDTPTLSTIKRYKGEIAAHTVAVQIILNFISKFNVKYPMDEETIYELAFDILDNYHYLNIAEFKFCFSKALRSENFHRLDYNVLLTIVENYVENRHLKTQSSSYSNHLQVKEPSSAPSNKSNKDLRARARAILDVQKAQYQYANK